MRSAWQHKNRLMVEVAYWFNLKLLLQTNKLVTESSSNLAFHDMMIWVKTRHDAMMLEFALNIAEQILNQFEWYFQIILTQIWIFRKCNFFSIFDRFHGMGSSQIWSFFNIFFVIFSIIIFNLYSFPMNQMKPYFFSAHKTVHWCYPLSFGDLV